ncbi:sugar phosphate isomerase/epimerase family protein [Desulfothermobacter acidiphilus]|uniref:sugar phosphate isomerase/epimerase family protein n=1 Tax=Desulfothermobacter acidiphilus TaxID=1938353 RepID=UPI003F8CA18B
MFPLNKRIFVSTLVLVQPEEREALIAQGTGIEIFAEGPEWQDFNNGINYTKEYLRNHKGPRSLHAPFFDLNLASEYSSIRELTLKILQHTIESAPELECEYVVIHPHNYSSHMFNRARASQRVKEALDLLARKAQQAGVKLAVENVGYGPTQLYDSQEFVSLIYEIDGIVALLDVGHAYLNGWDIPRVIGQLGERLVALHLHDNRGQADEHLPLGMGKINFQPVWDALSRSPAKPALVLEYYQVPLPEVLTGINYLQRIFGKGEKRQCP